MRRLYLFGVLKELNSYSEMVAQDIEQLMREKNVDAVTVVLKCTQVWLSEREHRVMCECGLDPSKVARQRWPFTIAFGLESKSCRRKNCYRIATTHNKLIRINRKN